MQFCGLVPGMKHYSSLSDYMVGVLTGSYMVGALTRSFRSCLISGDRLGSCVGGEKQDWTDVQWTPSDLATLGTCPFNKILKNVYNMYEGWIIGDPDAILWSSA